MREMFRTVFSSITTFFRAFELGASTLENYAKWAEGESSAFEQESRVERMSRLQNLNKQLESDGTNIEVLTTS